MHIKTGKFGQLFDSYQRESQLSTALIRCLADGASCVAALNGGLRNFAASALASDQFNETVEKCAIFVEYFR